MSILSKMKGIRDGFNAYWLIAIVLVVVSSLSPGLAGFAKVSKKSSDLGWIFHIKTERGGFQSMYLNKDSIRFKHKSLTVIMVAPKFDATIYNTSTQKFCSIPYKKWMKRYNPSESRVMVPVGKPKSILGFKSRAYRSKMKTKNLVKEFWMTDEPEIEPKIQRFFSKVLNTPLDTGIPLKIRVLRRGDTPQVIWNVVSFKRKKLGSSLFLVPKGYREVKSEMELLINDDDTDGMSDLLR